MTVAYLDPGSGSLIASVLVGGVAAAGVAAKQARARFSGLGRKRKRAEPAPEAPSDATGGEEQIQPADDASVGSEG